MTEQFKWMLAATVVVGMMAGSLVLQSPAEEPKIEVTAVKADDKEAAALEKALDFNDDVQRISYVIGTKWGQSLKAQSVAIDIEFLVRGIKDMLDGKKPALSPEEQNEVMGRFRKKLEEEGKKEAQVNLAKSKAFLEENKSKEGVKVLPSGLQYKVIKEGNGATPKASDRVKTHYRGTLISGEEFDSSYKRNAPAEFGVTGVIKGWVEALQLMKEGGKWELYIPPDLAYGPQGRPSIPPNSALVFEIELLEVVKKEIKQEIKATGSTGK